MVTPRVYVEGGEETRDVVIEVPLDRVVSVPVSVPVTNVVDAVRVMLRTLVIRYLTRYVSGPATVYVTRPVTTHVTRVVSELPSYVATRVETNVTSIPEGGEKRTEAEAPGVRIPTVVVRSGGKIIPIPIKVRGGG